jgi:hypothetical protein
MVETNENSEYKRRLGDLWVITQEFLSGIRFIATDAGRGEGTWDHHLLSCVFDDILESAFGILVLAREGGSNSAKRELRFLLELSIKVCCVEQSHGEKTLEEKMVAAKEMLDSTNIGIKKRIQLELLPEGLREEFRTELGKLYGSACNWVHVTVEQINDRIDRVDRGITAGKEDLPELADLIAQLERCYAAVLVLFLHSVPAFIAGDLLVESDGTSHRWCFEGSRFIAAIERLSSLDRVKSRRKECPRF